MLSFNGTRLLVGFSLSVRLSYFYLCLLLFSSRTGLNLEMFKNCFYLFRFLCKYVINYCKGTIKLADSFLCKKVKS